MSILDNRPGLDNVVGQVAETAGYLWQKGWAERNGGNITVNVTGYAGDQQTYCNRHGSTEPKRELFLLQRNPEKDARPGTPADGKRLGNPHT